MQHGDDQPPKRDEESVTRDMMFLDQEFRRVVDQHFHVQLRHDMESVARLDALFHQSALAQIARDDERNVSLMLAAYLGETVRALAKGGRWKLDDALGPCVVEVPRVKGSVRVLARARRRIATPGPALLQTFITQAVGHRA